jgi:GTPase SAR1 family protein
MSTKSEAEDINPNKSEDSILTVEQENPTKKVVVIGLKKSGKTTVANALLGQELFPSEQRSHRKERGELEIEVLDLPAELAEIEDVTSEEFTEKYSDFLFEFITEGVDCVLFCMVDEPAQ